MKKKNKKKKEEGEIFRFFFCTN